MVFFLRLSRMDIVKPIKVINDTRANSFLGNNRRKVDQTLFSAKLLLQTETD